MNRSGRKPRIPLCRRRGARRTVAPAVAAVGAWLAMTAPLEARPATTAGAAQGAIERVQQQLVAGGLDPRLVAQPLGEARRALRRAQGARDAGDAVHAPLLERLAVEWARTAGATVRAARAAARAEVHAKRSRDLRTKLERARALLTELQARQGRLQAEVNKAEQAASTQHRKAADAESRRLDRAAGKGPPQARRSERSSGGRPASAPARRPDRTRTGGKR